MLFEEWQGLVLVKWILSQRVNFIDYNNMVKGKEYGDAILFLTIKFRREMSNQKIKWWSLKEIRALY